jgi:hypothetical protein
MQIAFAKSVPHFSLPAEMKNTGRERKFGRKILQI